MSLAKTWKVEFSDNVYAKVTEALEGRIALKASGLQSRAAVALISREYCPKRSTSSLQIAANKLMD